MDIESVDPDLREATRKLPVSDASKRVTRAAIRLATRLIPVPQIDGVTVTNVKVGNVRLRVYQPDARQSDAGLLWIPGGGLLYGDARQDKSLYGETAHHLGIPVNSVNYRFAPSTHSLPPTTTSARPGRGCRSSVRIPLGL